MWNNKKIIFKFFQQFSLKSIIPFSIITITIIGCGCGGGGGDGGGNGDNLWVPSISNLNYSPISTTVGTGEGTITVKGTVDFVDTDGNVSYFQIDIYDSVGNLVETGGGDIVGAFGLTSGTVAGTVSANTSVAGDYTFKVFIRDMDNV